jgi:hypothetical protein
MSYVNSGDHPNLIPQTMSEHLRLVAARSDFDGMFQEAAVKSLRHPLRPRTLVLVGVASGFAAAIGVSAIVAFLFFVLVPNQVNAMATERTEHWTVPSAGADKITPEESQALLEKFEQFRMLPAAETAKITPEESQALLVKFAQWQQRQ